MRRLLGPGLWRWMALVASLIAPGALGAPREDHLAWVEPEQFTATPGSVLTLHHRRGPAFGVAGTRVTAADIESVHVEVAGIPAPTAGFVRPGADARTLVTLMYPGYALVEVTLRPQRRTVVANEVEGYLRSLHASDEVRALWAQQPKGAEWIEIRRFSLKTALKVGKTTENEPESRRNKDAGWELTSAQSPFGLRKNDRFRVQVLDQGSPVAGVLVDFVSSGETVQHVVATDENGIAEATLDAPGLWLVHAVDMKRVDTDQLEWVIDYAALTVSVEG